MAYLPVYVNLLGSGTSVPHYGEAKASLPIKFKFHLFLVSEISGKKLKLVPSVADTFFLLYVLFKSSLLFSSGF
jgi:hypothetical protein